MRQSIPMGRIGSDYAFQNAMIAPSKVSIRMMGVGWRGDLDHPEYTTGKEHSKKNGDRGVANQERGERIHREQVTEKAGRNG